MIHTAFEQIVDLSNIGKHNEKNLNEILALAKREQIKPSNLDEKKVLFLGIDIQNDFLEGGALGVPGSIRDVENITQFIYKHLDKITTIAVSIDTHRPMQVFHANWWVDQDGNHPEPMTVIEAKDVENGKWKAIRYEKQSLDYVKNLERLGKKQLIIWPYHCIEGTHGVSLEGQFANLAYFHSVARNSPLKTIVKGLEPTTEMYGIFQPEYSPTNSRNNELLEEIANYDLIIFAGEAKSHCVLESLMQLINYCKEKEINTNKIVVLEDCMSSITGFEQQTETIFKQLANDYGVQLTQSVDFKW
ncbi:isochorismatase family protein [Bacillus kwashiorkori]|uniref:isochorismatase family protein n=1 Tax=Bacillus kwashiorkori TaxID=1522318 RepID=UPI000785EEB4|nr:isochorismatase family protein [Bacillus kwashiorkori]